MKSALRCAHINKALRHFFPILNRVPRFSRPVRESLPLSETKGGAFAWRRNLLRPGAPHPHLN